MPAVTGGHFLCPETMPTASKRSTSIDAAMQDDARTRGMRVRKERFLKAFALTANISYAAKAAKVSRMIVYVWQEKDDKFAAEMNQAREQAYDRLEKEALRRAVDGIVRKRPVVSNGKVVEWEVYREYSDRMLELLLKAGRPEKYRERFDMTTGGQPMVKEVSADLSAVV